MMHDPAGRFIALLMRNRADLQARWRSATLFVVLAATQLAVPASATDYPLPGRKLTMTVRGSRQKIVLVAKGPLTTLPFPEPVGAIKGTGPGGKLRIVNPTSGESSVIDLPASGWTKRSHHAVFKFTNPSAPRGFSPVKTVLVAKRSGLRIVAKTAGLTLDEARQGNVGLVLAFGRVHYCALFGGTVLKDAPGAFVAKDAPAPASCPGTPSCGDGILDDDEECDGQLFTGACPSLGQVAVTECAACRCFAGFGGTVSLLWSDTNDLDLHVIGPDGMDVNPSNPCPPRGGGCGPPDPSSIVYHGDANAGCIGTNSTTPAETVTWGRAAPHGTYTVRVDFFKACDGGSPTPVFSVRTLVDGTPHFFDGTATVPSPCVDPCGFLCTCTDVTSFTR